MKVYKGIAKFGPKFTEAGKDKKICVMRYIIKHLKKEVDNKALKERSRAWKSAEEIEKKLG